MHAELPHRNVINDHPVHWTWKTSYQVLINQSIIGYWHQRADERHGNPPQDNQELLVVKDKIGRLQVSLG